LACKIKKKKKKKIKQHGWIGGGDGRATAIVIVMIKSVSNLQEKSTVKSDHKKEQDSNTRR
jgi:hypothetical protein